MSTANSANSIASILVDEYESTLANSSAIVSSWIDCSTVDKFQLTGDASASGMTATIESKATSTGSVTSSSVTYTDSSLYQVSLAPRQRYMRFTWTNNTGAQVTDASLQVKVTYGSSDRSTVAPLNSVLSETTQATVTQSVIKGFAKSSFVGAFSGLNTFHSTPIVQIANKYKIDPANLNEVEIFEATGGSADNSVNLFRCQTGTSVGGYGVLRSTETLNYRAGQGVNAMFTASFTTGIANSLQFGGMFNLTDTVAFGYDGADFSCLHSYDGAADERLITVTATGAGTCTVTLANDAVNITVTNSDVQTNAEELRAGLEGDATLSGKWRFEQVDDKVYAISKTAAVQSGTFSISGGITASIVQKTAGQAKTDGHIAQADWNVNSTPFTGFDPTKLNVYKIGFGYLGVANITFEIYNPNTGSFVMVHQIEWANNNNTTHISKPNLKVGWTAASLGSSGTNLTVLGASAAIFLEGDEILKNNTFGANNVVGSLGTTLTNLVTVKSRLVYGNYYNLGKVFPLTITVDNEHNKAVIVEVYRNPTVAGTTNYQFTDEFNSISVVDKSGTTVTNGDLIDSFIVAANGNIREDLTVLKTELLPTDIFVVAAKTVSGTSAGDTTVSITWKEEK